jgi:ribosomal protein L40E
MHVRICRDCGEEYRPEAVRCADCGGELEDRKPGEEPEAPPPEPDEAPVDAAGHRALFLTPRAAELVPLAERLRETRIEYRLAQQPAPAAGAPARYALLVRDEDAAGALSALADLLAPDEPAEGIRAVETRFDPGRGYVQCPACGAEPPPGADECPGCGLGLGGEPEAERD